MRWPGAGGQRRAKPDHGNPHHQNRGAARRIWPRRLPSRPCEEECGHACRRAVTRSCSKSASASPKVSGGLSGYDSLPYDVRNRYGASLDPQARYIYDNGYLYRVDPATMVVSQVLQTILH